MRRETDVKVGDITNTIRAFLADSTDLWSNLPDCDEIQLVPLAARLEKVLKSRDLPMVFLESGDQRGESFICAGRRSPDFVATSSRTPTGGEGSPDLQYMRERWAAESEGIDPSELAPLQSGGVGYLSYDFVRSIEAISDRSRRDLKIPVAHFFFPSLIIRLDHSTNRVHILLHRASLRVENDLLYWHGESLDQLLASPEAELPPLPSHHPEVPYRDDEDLPEGYALSSTRAEFVEGVERAKAYIEAGDTFQVNLSLRVDRSFHADPFTLYRALREVNPSPYMSFLRIGEVTLVGASPEQLVRVEGGTIATRPIAGTRRRGRTEEEGRRKEAELLGSEKERAEHLMLVDLERNDIGRVATYGTVSVDEFMTLERYSHVVHIVSNVSARLRDGEDSFDVIAAMFPGGTITGAPKVRSMEIIDEIEPVARGIYTGSIGWIGGDGSMELNIAIRSILLHEGRAYVQAGAGIVYDSVGELEYRESLKKMAASIEAIERVAGKVAS